MPLKNVMNLHAVPAVLLFRCMFISTVGTVLAGAVVGVAVVLIQSVLIAVGLTTTTLSPRYVVYLLASSVLVAVAFYVTTVVFVMLGDTK